MAIWKKWDCHNAPVPQFRFITRRKLRRVFKAIRLYYMRNHYYQLHQWCISQKSILYTNGTKKDSPISLITHRSIVSFTVRIHKLTMRLASGKNYLSRRHVMMMNQTVLFSVWSFLKIENQHIQSNPIIFSQFYVLYMLITFVISYNVRNISNTRWIILNHNATKDFFVKNERRDSDEIADFSLANSPKASRPILSVVVTRRKTRKIIAVCLADACSAIITRFHCIYFRRVSRNCFCHR